MDIEKDVGNITYAVVPPLPKMKSEAIFDKPLQLEFTYVSPEYVIFYFLNLNKVGQIIPMPKYLYN